LSVHLAVSRMPHNMYIPTGWYVVKR
jgi:hypothetical protein